MPALTTIAIFSLTAHGNDFLGPLIYLSNSTQYTLAMGINHLRSFWVGGDLAPQMAASVMFVTPCVILFFVPQKYFAQGIVTTGLKGRTLPAQSLGVSGPLWAFRGLLGQCPGM